MKQNGWPDPTPLSLFVVGGLLIGGFFPVLAEFVSMGAMPLVGCILISSGIALLILLVVCLKNGDLFGACLSGVFGVLLALAPGAIFLTQFSASGMGVEVDPRLTGWYLTYCAPVFLVLLFPAGKRLWHMALVFLVFVILFALLGPVFAGYLSDSMLPVLGWVTFAVGLYFLYLAAAMMINTEFPKPILPLGGPLFK